MKLPQFELFEAASLPEASEMLRCSIGESRVLAGGTDVLVKMKQRRQVWRVLVDIKRVRGLDGLAHEPGRGLGIGALVTLETLRQSALVRRFYPLLHDAVSCAGTLEIRNCATLVGNVCNASPAADTVSALTLLGARLRVIGAQGERRAPMAGFISGPGRTVLAAGELVAGIDIPEPQQHFGAAYDKFSLRRMDLAVVGVAAMVALEEGRCADVRIMLSSVAPVAMRAGGAEAALAGRSPDDAAIAAAAKALAAEARPKTDLFGTVEQKRAMAAALAERVIRRALERARAVTP